LFHAGEQGSNEIILYDLYLQSKVQGGSYYELFLAQMTKQSR
jgi:hypothetical protein